MATEYEVVFRVEAESSTDVRDLADQLRHAVVLASRRVDPGLYGRVRISGWFAQAKYEAELRAALNEAVSEFEEWKENL